MDFQSPKRPESVTKPLPNLIAYGAGVAAFFGAIAFGVSGFSAMLLALVVTGSWIACYDLLVMKVHTRESVGLGAQRPHDVKRVLTKIVGLMATLLVVLSISEALVPFIGRSASKILAYYPLVFAVILVMAPAYILWTDRRMEAPKDGTYHIGCLVLGRWRGRNWSSVKHYALGWAIKAYFLPIMFGGLVSVAAGLERAFHAPPDTFVGIYFAAFRLVLFIDLMVAVLGYSLMLRVLDTHIRTCNPLAWGWVVTIICYAPFWGILAPYLFDFGDGMNWSHWFADNPILLVISGTSVLLMKVSWAYANCCFGLRFSNLTHRGIITNGAFRWSKHPSMISKNIGWWLIGLPFLNVLGWEAALSACIALITVNVVYFLRARAEERHLSEDPDYVAYALWINEHGLFAWLGRLIPLLRYVPPSDTAQAVGLPARVT